MQMTATNNKKTNLTHTHIHTHTHTHTQDIFFSATEQAGADGDMQQQLDDGAGPKFGQVNSMFMKLPKVRENRSYACEHTHTHTLSLSPSLSLSLSLSLSFTLSFTLSHTLSPLTTFTYFISIFPPSSGVAQGRDEAG